MLITFFGQLLFDNAGAKVGIEVLARGDRGEDHISPIVAPSEIFNLPEFQPHHFYALDMQVISHLNMLSEEFKKLPDLNYLFVNVSDVLLKELVCGDDDSLPFSSIVSLSKKLMPVKLVLEISESSTIRPEHLVLIVSRLKKNNILLAQDDFDNGRLPYLGSSWDFIKINADQLTEQGENIKPIAPLVIERAQFSDMRRGHGFLYQGFEW